MKKKHKIEKLSKSSIISPRAFTFGQRVYLVTDELQAKRMVIGYAAYANGGVSFLLGCGNDKSWHAELEISETKKY